MAAPEEYVTRSELRRRFNEGRYYERMQSGELTPDIHDVGPAPRRFGDDVKSQMVGYIDAAGRTIAIVHQYGLPSGAAAMDTLPDPMFLFEGGVRYKIRR
jgi:hypothetical protein